MFEPARAAGRDDWNTHGVSYRARQLDVVAVARAVAVHARQQNLARAQLLGSRRPLDGVTPDGAATAVREDLPARRRVARDTPPRINRHDHALAAEHARALRYQLRALDRRGVERNFVRARAQDGAHVLNRVQPAAHGERDEDLVGHAAHEFGDDGALA